MSATLEFPSVRIFDGGHQALCVLKSVEHALKLITECSDGVERAFGFGQPFGCNDFGYVPTDPILGHRLDSQRVLGLVGKVVHALLDLAEQCDGLRDLAAINA
jgi:hypothetical protein